MSGINPIASLLPLESITRTGGMERIGEKQIGLTQAVGQEKDQGQNSDFAAFLNQAIKEVDSLQAQANVANEGLLTGNIEDFHTAVIAMEKANLSMSLTVEVRNKVLDAYHEMMRMQI